MDQATIAQWDPASHYRDPKIAREYETARFHSFGGSRGNQREIRGLLRALEYVPALHTALDAPAGTGRITRVLLERGLQVTGADISLEMLDEARQNLNGYGSRLSLLQADLRKLPFPDDSFDAVTCVRLFGHFPSERRVDMLREMRRVARSRVIVMYFYMTRLIRLKRWVKRNMLHTYEGVVHPTTKATALREIRESGLRAEAVFYVRRYYSEEIYVVGAKSN